MRSQRNVTRYLRIDHAIFVMPCTNNPVENEVQVLIGNVWEAINYAMFEENWKKKHTKKKKKNIPKTIGQVGNKKTVWSMWKQIKILYKSTSTIFKLVKANLVSP